MKALLRITYCFIITLLIPMIVHCQWIDESPAITNAFLDVFLLNKDEGWACGQSVIVKTTDGGENWRRVGTEYSGIFRGIQFVDANVGYVVGSNGTVLKSIDGGESWFETNVNTNHGLLDLYFIN